jgi:hypothetical protein
MSSTKLSALIDEFPEEADAVERLAALLDRYAEILKPQHGPPAYPSNYEQPQIELTVQRLFDVVKPSSQRVLSRMLARLVEEGVLKRTVRVESIAKGGIGDFNSVGEIPAVLFDEHVGHNVEVTLDQLREIYRLPATLGG